jgi:hypothetical protein
MRPGKGEDLVPMSVQDNMEQGGVRLRENSPNSSLVGLSFRTVRTGQAMDQPNPALRKYLSSFGSISTEQRTDRILFISSQLSADW